MTNTELNRKAAEVVMGWVEEPSSVGCNLPTWSDKFYVHLSDAIMEEGRAWNPTEDRNQAYMLLEKVAEAGKSWHVAAKVMEMAYPFEVQEIGWSEVFACMTATPETLTKAVIEVMEKK